MNKKCFFIILLFFPLFSSAQKGAEIGANIGFSSYIGDINQYKLFYAPRVSGGAFIRHNFSQHYAFRLNMNYNRIQGNDKDFVNSLYKQVRNYSFQTELIEVGAMGEFNFLPLNPGLIRKTKEIVSPYLIAGVSVYMGNRGESGNQVDIAIPFGFGSKYYVTPEVGIGFEWVWRKTFSDGLDQIDPYVFRENASQFINKQRNINNNSDWYYIFAATISYRFVKNESLCPAYK